MTLDDINELLNEVKKIGQMFPGIFKRVDDIAKNKKEDEWDDLCYVPAVEIMALLHQFYSTDPEYSAQIAQMIAAITNWRRTKQIYSFPKEMRELLYSQDMRYENIPVETLRALPFSCVFIEADDILDDTTGFFVYFDAGVDDVRLELRMIGIGESPTPLLVPLKKGATISSTVDDLVNEIKTALKNQGYNSDKVDEAMTRSFGGLGRFKELYVEQMNKIMQLILYICSANADVKENSEQKKIYRKRKEGQAIKDRLKEVQAHDCGEEIAVIVRKMKKNGTYYVYEGESSHKGKGTHKRPHVRKGYYHHYWKSKRGGEDRTLVLNWIAPTFINSALVDEAEVVTINEG